MVANYVKIALRNIRKRKLYSFINAFGLSIAIAFCVMIYLFVRDEQSFDQFHANKESIYRLHFSGFSEEKFKKDPSDAYHHHAYMPAKLGEVMQDELAEVKYMTRFIHGNEGVMRYGDKALKQEIAMADSGFFSMFSFRVLQGSVSNVFANPTDAVLTPDVATRFFGDDDPIGKEFTFDMDGEKPYTVVAVVEAPPANSSIPFEMILPITSRPWFERSREQWGNFSYPTFVMLQDNANVKQFGVNLDTLVNKYMGARFKGWRERENIPAEYYVADFNISKLTDIHQQVAIGWHKVSDPKYTWILSGIAVLILIIACINYIALALTTSATRRVEVGIRKTAGAQRSQLVAQFGVESLALAYGSLLVGLLLVVLFLPYFNEFTGKAIVLSMQNLPEVVLVAGILTTLVGVLAGSYPSLYLSGFLPALVLKGRFTGKMSAGFTQPLVGLQFILSSFLIISSVIMYKQMKYITTKDLGFDEEQLLAIETHGGWSEEADKTVAQFRQATLHDPDVVSVSGTSSSFNRGWSRYGYRIKDENKSAYVYRVDAEYIPTLNIELVAGRNFNPDIPADSAAIIINEALAKDMGYTDPLSEHLNWREDTTSLGSPIIGVVKDFHFLSLEREIEPMFISMDKQYVGYMTTILVRVTPGEIQTKLSKLKEHWNALYPDRPFAYSFVDDDIAGQYVTYSRWMKIMTLATGFAIVIACLGLFGLAGVNAVNRTKEVGIRKVMGAELSSLFILLNKQYVALLVVAFVFAAPLSWYVMQEWLGNFKYSISLHWSLFALSFLLGIAVAILTVSYHAIRTARLNPADTLKYE